MCSKLTYQLKHEICVDRGDEPSSLDERDSRETPKVLVSEIRDEATEEDDSCPGNNQ